MVSDIHSYSKLRDLIDNRHHANLDTGPLLATADSEGQIIVFNLDIHEVRIKCDILLTCT